MKLLCLVLVLCGVATAWSYHAPREVGPKKQIIPMKSMLEKLTDLVAKIVDFKNGSVEILSKMVLALKPFVHATFEIGDELAQQLERLHEKVNADAKEIIHLLLQKRKASSAKSEIIQTIISVVVGKLQEILEKIGNTGLISEELQGRLAGWLDFVSDYADRIPTVIKEKLQEIRTRVGDHLRNIIDRIIGPKETKQMSVLETLHDQLIKIVNDIKDWLKTHITISDELKGKLTGVLEFLNALHLKISENLKTALEGLKDLLPEAVRDLINKLINRQSSVSRSVIEDLQNKVIEIVNNIKEYLKTHITISDELRQKFTNILTALKAAIEALHLKISETVRTALESLKELLPESLKNLINDLLNRDRSVARSIIDDLQTKVLEVLNNIKDWLKTHITISDDLKGRLTGLLESLRAIVTTLHLKISEHVRTALEGLRDLLPEPIRKIIDDLLGKTSSVSRAILEEWHDMLVDIVAKIREYLKTHITISDELRNRLAGILEALHMLHIKIGDNLRTALESLKDLLPEPIRDLINKVINQGRSVSSMKKADILSDSLKTALDTLAVALQAGGIFAQGLARKASEILTQVMETVGSLSQDVINKITEILGKFREKLPKDVVDNFEKVLKPKAVTFRHLRMADRASIFDFIFNFGFETILGTLKTILEQGGVISQDLIQRLSGIISKALEMVGSVSDKALNLIKDILTIAGDKIPDKIKDDLETIVGGKNNTAGY